MEEVSFFAAFFAGFLSFLAPCILPLLPPYFSWLLGISKEDFQKKEVKSKLFFHSLLLVLGFSIIFIVLGVSASKFGQVLALYRLPFQRIGGLIIIFLGLEFIGFLKIFKNHYLGLFKELLSRVDRQTSSFLVGLIFAFAWVACFSPILGAILILASFQGTLLQGVILLSFYSLGLAIPFLLTSLFLGFLIEKLEIFTKITKWVNLFSGLILILLGILLASDNYYKIVIWFEKIL